MTVVELNPIGGGRKLIDRSAELSDKLKEAIYDYCDEDFPLALAIGVIEIVKVEVLKAHEQ